MQIGEPRIRAAGPDDVAALSVLAKRPWSDALAGRIDITVWDENGRAVRLYERYGFQPAGTTTFTVVEKDMEDLVMLLDKAAGPG